MSARVSRGCGWDGMDVVWALLILNASWIKGGSEGRVRIGLSAAVAIVLAAFPPRSGDQGPDIE